MIWSHQRKNLNEMERKPGGRLHPSLRARKLARPSCARTQRCGTPGPAVHAALTWRVASEQGRRRARGPAQPSYQRSRTTDRLNNGVRAARWVCPDHQADGGGAASAPARNLATLPTLALYVRPSCTSSSARARMQCGAPLASPIQTGARRSRPAARPMHNSQPSQA